MRSAFVSAVFAVVCAGSFVLFPSPKSSSLARTQRSIAVEAQNDLESPAHADPRFVHSFKCADCHAYSPDSVAMLDEDKNRLAPYELWRGTMMANASRDPLWRAVLSVEIATFPKHREKIEAKCMKCHAPAAWHLAEAEGRSVTLADLKRDDDLGEIARDGVTCSVCHQIRPEGLGESHTFSGNFKIGTDNKIYGPHLDPIANIMRNFVGYEATHSEHVLSSGLCGTCHTLFTEALDQNGAPTGIQFPEQTPYLEWRNSAFNDERAPLTEDAASCQDCHVPTRDERGRPIATRIARNPGGFDFGFTRPRQPFGRHVFVGGNTLIPAVLRDHQDELEVEANTDQLNGVIRAARDQLNHRTATITMADVDRSEAHLRFTLTVKNLTGHKLPTAHPTRRAWIEVVVTDANEKIVFASGRTDARGRLVTGAGLLLPSEQAGGPILPFPSLVEREDHVPLFEGVMNDVTGKPTYHLLAGASYAKDTRILPKGYRADHPDAAFTAPAGVSIGPDFDGGIARVRYGIPTLHAGPHRVTVRLRYQTLGARYAAELFTVKTPEVENLKRYLSTANVEGEVLATLDVTVE